MRQNRYGTKTEKLGKEEISKYRGGKSRKNGLTLRCEAGVYINSQDQNRWKNLDKTLTNYLGKTLENLITN